MGRRADTHAALQSEQDFHLTAHVNPGLLDISLVMFRFSRRGALQGHRCLAFDEKRGRNNPARCGKVWHSRANCCGLQSFKYKDVSIRLFTLWNAFSLKFVLSLFLPLKANDLILKVPCYTNFTFPMFTNNNLSLACQRNPQKLQVRPLLLLSVF